MPLSIEIIYTDPEFLVINKPAGVLVHGVRATPHREASSEETVVSWLQAHYPEVATVGDDPRQRPGIVHRLDKETSGVLLITRTQNAFEYFKKLFQTHEVQKTYQALVWGEMETASGIIDKPIGIKSGTIKRSVHSDKMAKPAVTEYRTVRSLTISGQPYTLLEVMPRTGRTHQIRVHLAAIGHPVMGDKLYGGKRSFYANLNRHFLHALAIEFTAPNGKRIKCEAALPDELTRVLTSAE